MRRRGSRLIILELLTGAHGLYVRQNEFRNPCVRSAVGGSLRVAEVPLGIFAATDHHEGSQEAGGFIDALNEPFSGLGGSCD